MSGGSKQTTTQSNTIDPQLMALYQQNYAKASNVASTPTQAYTGELSAPINPTLAAGNTALTTTANNNTGAADLNTASNAVQGILSGPGVTAGQISNTDLTPYLNPYTDDVVNTSLADLERQRQIQQVADNQAATAGNAFGGSRAGVADSLTNDAYLRDSASTAANLRSQGYNTALGAAQTDISNKLNADEFNTNTKSSAATQLAGLSNDELTQALQRAGALETAGTSQQQTQETADQAAYQEWLRQLQDPEQKQQLLNQALGIIPVQQSQTSTSTTSGGGGMLGGILGGVGSLASGLGALGGSGGAAGLLALSDGRTKTDIETLRHDERGRRWVSFRYKWEPVGTLHEGVIAQEVMKTDPLAVHMGTDGLYRVDYAALQAA